MKYIFGDIHGELKTLIKLISKLDNFTDAIFVGDLIDKGPYSKQVIAFVKDNGFKTVLGNHEDMMIKYGKEFIHYYPDSFYISMIMPWLGEGGFETLLSYGLIRIDRSGKMEYINNKPSLEKFAEDIKWLETLPLYIEIENMTKNNLPIVISHALLAEYWNYMYIDTELFRKKALWNRNPPSKKIDIFNIHGHTIVDKIDTNLNYLNLDTGCHKNSYVNPSLSTYCLDSGEIYSQHKIK